MWGGYESGDKPRTTRREQSVSSVVKAGEDSLSEVGGCTAGESYRPVEAVQRAVVSVTHGAPMVFLWPAPPVLVLTLRTPGALGGTHATTEPMPRWGAGGTAHTRRQNRCPAGRTGVWAKVVRSALNPPPGQAEVEMAAGGVQRGHPETDLYQ